MDWKTLTLQRLANLGMPAPAFLEDGAPVLTKAEGLVINADTCEIRGMTPHRNHELLLIDTHGDAEGQGRYRWVQAERSYVNRLDFSTDTFYRLPEQRKMVVSAARCAVQADPAIAEQRVRIHFTRFLQPFEEDDPLPSDIEHAQYETTFAELAEGKFGEPFRLVPFRRPTD